MSDEPSYREVRIVGEPETLAEHALFNEDWPVGRVVDRTVFEHPITYTEVAGASGEEMSRLDTIASRLATIQLYREENGSGDGWSITDDAAYLLERVRTLDAALQGALAYDGHVFNCPAQLESEASGDCSPKCRAARAALAGEG